LYKNNNPVKEKIIPPKFSFLWVLKGKRNKKLFKKLDEERVFRI
jgi:hypothetical protein